MGLEKPQTLALRELIDADTLRRDLTALAKETGDPGTLRQKGMVLIKQAFQDGREKVKYAVEKEGLPGLPAARALSQLQDTIIQVIYDFAVKHVYYAQNPSSAERIAVVATGGYGRGELAPGSDIDLLFLRPFKQTAWGESVIEFILYMLWDLGLKVGHATRSLAESVRLAKLDITIRTAILEARYLWGDQGLYEDLRKKFWNEVATGNGRDFVEAKLAERSVRHERQGESRYLVEPNIKEGKGGLRDLQTLYWIGKYLYHVDDAADLVDYGVFTREEYRTFQKAEAFLWNVRVHLHYLMGRAEERLSFDVQPSLAAQLGYVDAEKPRRAVEAFMRAYFLVAKDVGDLTRIFCAALEEQHRKVRPAFALTHSLADPYNFDHPLAAHMAQEARVIAQAHGHNPGEPVIGAPPVFLFEPHQTEQCDWKPNVLLDISSVWEKKRSSIECMTGQEHLWEYYTHVALRRGNQCRRNGGNKSCTHAEAYQRIFPETPEVLA